MLFHNPALVCWIDHWVLIRGGVSEDSPEDTTSGFAYFGFVDPWGLWLCGTWEFHKTTSSKIPQSHILENSTKPKAHIIKAYLIKTLSLSLAQIRKRYFKTKLNFCLLAWFEFASERLQFKLSTRGILNMFFDNSSLKKLDIFESGQ